MSLQETSAAYIAWVDSLGIQVDNIQQFGDPNMMIKLVRQVDNNQVVNRISQSTLSKSNSKDFLQKLHIFKQLLNEMEKEYTALGHAFDDNINLVAICARNDVAELNKMLKLCLLLAVSCEEQETHISEIMGLEEDVQRSIMNIIEPATTSGESESNDNDNNSNNPDNQVLYDGDGPEEREFLLEQEIARLLAENETLKSTNENLEIKNKGLIKEQQELKNQLDMNETSYETVIKHSESETELSKHIAELEEKLREKEKTNNEHEQTIKQLSHSLENTDSQRDGVIQELRGQLQDSEQRVARLGKIESIAERYKRKLQDSKNLERHVEFLENENQELKDKLGGSKKSIAMDRGNTQDTVGDDELGASGGSGAPHAAQEGAAATAAAVTHDSIEQIKLVLENDSLDPELPEQFETLVKAHNYKSKQVEQLTQELNLVSGAWYAISSRIQQQNVAVMKKAYETPRGWLTRQRKALDKLM